MPSGIYTRTKEMNTGKNPNSWHNTKGKHWKVKDTSNMHSRKGIELSKSHKNNIRKSMMGRKILWKDKISKSHIGKTLSEQAKRRLRENAKINPNYGMKKKHHTKDSKNKIRMGHLGKKQTEEHKINAVNGRRKNGYFVSTKTRERMRESRKKQIMKPCSKETREKHRIFRSTQIFPIKDTSIEVKIQNFLKLLHIEFITHHYISEITHAYQCDIYIPSKKSIIETDGCYWHGCKICNKKINKWQIKQIEKDNQRTKELQESGYNVIRLWEHEIKKITLNQFNKKLCV